MAKRAPSQTASSGVSNVQAAGSPLSEILEPKASKARKALSKASHGGTKHFLAERVTSIALIPLCLWAVVTGIRVVIAPEYENVLGIFGNPIQAVIALLFLIVAFWHMHLGVRVIIEDYLHRPSFKFAALLLNQALCFIGLIASAYAILWVSYVYGTFS